MADSAASTPEGELSDTPFDSPSPSSPPFPSSPSATSPLSLNVERPTARTSVTTGATANMTPSSTPLGNINAARNPGGGFRQAPPTMASRASGLNVNADILKRLEAVRLGRQGAPPAGAANLPQSPGPVPNNMSPKGPMAGGVPTGFAGVVPPNFAGRLPGGKPPMPSFASAPAVTTRAGGPQPKLSMAERRGAPKLGGLPGAAPAGGAPAGKKRPGLTLSQMNGGAPDAEPKKQETALDKYSDFIDTKTGSLKFAGKAVLNPDGVQFANGTSFNISLDEVDTLDELGKGNYGTVYKVRHSRPRMRKVGQGLAGNKAAPGSPSRKDFSEEPNPTTAKPLGGTGIIMAMKEVRLELDDSKFAAIIMELDVLHRCVSSYIVDFYGAFFQEGAVYICMEFMDGGSIDKLYGDGVPENVLRKITLATTMGLKSLKDEHNIIHRDVKPTNILMNTRGQIKICDFGVSGNLVASIAKTNIGCQSYMAPERISSGGVAQAGANPGGGTYSVQSDIWSLGLTIIECALGRYPYPPETYNNIFSQLSAIVDGEPPDLPEEGYSEAARNFVRGCLNKIPKLRPTYAMLLNHAWLAPMVKPETITEEDEDEVAAAEAAEIGVAAGDQGPAEPSNDVVDKEVADWVKDAIDKRKRGVLGKAPKPALHAAPLDAVSSPSQDGANGLDAAGAPEAATTT
ncbi:polymyxin B resistance protein kinase [Didymella exigua CBS 183.55]|uniref:mitogen-activated protein kinase kinase n=1 Tax=Didymella exigua CBS 183.55 TaxID=1150837 RepID=A0A6A5R8C3_9PLEO|nr:polymyxin B resistance protein kinase [Didymella exigua CBS 183.55]KAF1923224.1 polymyxin B resistance protein kinase [Didymella exigua CBS 183.55]